tara:strand:- start:536 stop:733 length:198 start_codon:yes stop_codon:yes gene_type:complete
MDGLLERIIVETKEVLKKNMDMADKMRKELKNQYQGYETLYHEAQIHTNILNGILTEYEKRKKML